MEQKINEIIRQVGNIGEKLSSLQSEESLPSIELDIILGDIRELYEQVKLLQKPSSQSVEVAEHVQETDAGMAPGEQAESGNTSTGDEPASSDTAPVKETATAEVSTGRKTASKAGAAAAGKAIEPSTIADKFKGEKKFINESLAGNLEKDNISSKIQSKPIQNINTALGVNDRFKLIRDLFNGDKESFQNTITILNGASNFNEAFNYITSSFDWDMEDESVQLLLELVRRKFIVNQNE